MEEVKRDIGVIESIVGRFSRQRMCPTLSDTAEKQKVKDGTGSSGFFRRKYLIILGQF